MRSRRLIVALSLGALTLLFFVAAVSAMPRRPAVPESGLGPATRLNTVPPGECSIGTAATVVYSTSFESGPDGWTHSGAIAGIDTWVLTSTNPFSGTLAWHVSDVASESDQRLASPAVLLPAGENPIVLKFWTWQYMEIRPNGGCFDGGILEVSSDGGASWTQIVAPSLLTDPYDGPVSTGFRNPLGGLDAWCGNEPQPYLNSLVDVSAYAGQTVQFRFRLGTDLSVERPGWDIDEVEIQTCRPVLPFFTNLVVEPASSAENDSITLTGTFTNANPPGEHSVTIDWGDDYTETLPTVGAGLYDISAAHQYLDDDPTATPSDLTAIQVQIVDNLAGSTITTVNVLIDNVAPVVAAGPDRITVLNVPVQFAGHFSDQGALDTHTSTWDFGDGSLPGQGMALTHVYTRTGVFTATLAVTDDDTGVGVDAALITVRAQWYLPLLRKN